MISHIWFDIQGTLIRQSPDYVEAHDRFAHEVYATATNRAFSPALAEEYRILYRQHGSHSAVFRSLGLPSDYWHQHYSRFDVTPYFQPDPNVIRTLQTLRSTVPISLFTNLKPAKAASSLALVDIDLVWFTHLLTGDDIAERKPALDGFHEMIRRSALPAKQLLYVGDRVDADIKPAKQAGMQTALVWATSPDADYSCERFEQLLDIPLSNAEPHL